MKRIGFHLLIYAYAASIFASGILTPIYAFFVQKIGGGILETCSAVAIFSIITGIVTLLIYKTTWSRTYQKECLLIGWCLWLISVCMYCCISSLTILFISQILNGLGNALSTSAYDAEYSEQTANDLAGGWSIFEGVTNIFSGIAALMGGLIVSNYGFQVLMWCMTGLATVSFGLILYYVYREKR